MPDEPLPDYYKILQVHPDAEQEFIRAARDRVARKYHPDHDTSPEAKVKMQAINDAYEVLGDPDKRSAYDARRRMQAAQAPALSQYGFSPFRVVNVPSAYRRTSDPIEEQAPVFKRKKRSFFKKLILTLFVTGIVLFGVGFVLVGALGILAALVGSSSQHGSFLAGSAILMTLVGAALYLAAVLGTLIGSARESRWGVFLLTLLFSFVGVLVYCFTD